MAWHDLERICPIIERGPLLLMLEIMTATFSWRRKCKQSADSYEEKMRALFLLIIKDDAKDD